jgi:hypothetical protein
MKTTDTRSAQSLESSAPLGANFENPGVDRYLEESLTAEFLSTGPDLPGLDLPCSGPEPNLVEIMEEGGV